MSGHTKPPAGAALNLAHPLAPTVLCCPLNEGAGTFARDLSPNGVRLASQGLGQLTGGAAFIGGKRGNVIAHTDTAHRVNFGESSFMPTGPCTVILGLKKRDATLRASGAFGVGTTGSRLGAHVPYSDGIVYWQYGGDIGGLSMVTASGLTFGDDIWAFTTGARGMEIWQNGILRASNTANPTRAATTETFALGQNTQLDASDLVDYYLFYMYAKQLSPEAVQWVTAEPFAPLMTTTARKFFVPAAPPVVPSDSWYGRVEGLPHVEPIQVVAF